MKQQDIKVFLAIAKHRSLSAAAEVLHYTQPTVSGYLSRLEQSLGVQLVKRTKGKREIELTPADRICNALILCSYPDDVMIETLLRCVKEFLSEHPQLQSLL